MKRAKKLFTKGLNKVIIFLICLTCSTELEKNSKKVLDRKKATPLPTLRALREDVEGAVSAHK